MQKLMFKVQLKEDAKTLQEVGLKDGTKLMLIGVLVLGHSLSSFVFVNRFLVQFPNAEGIRCLWSPAVTHAQATPCHMSHVSHFPSFFRASTGGISGIQVYGIR